MTNLINNDRYQKMDILAANSLVVGRDPGGDRKKMRKENMKLFAVFICAFMLLGQVAMAQEFAGGGAAIADDAENEWDVVWQDDGSAVDEYGEPELIPLIIMVAYAAYTAYTTYEDLKSGDYVSAIAGLLPQGKAIKLGENGVNLIKSMEKTKDRMKVGLETEKILLQILGKTGMKRQVTSNVDGVTVKTIPDYIDDAAKEVGEIKDYADANTVSNIKQIRAQMDWAKKNGYKYKLYLNDCSKRSGTLVKAMKDIGGICEPIKNYLTK